MKKHRKQKIRIRGLVREAQRARDTLSRGLAPRERGKFLDGVRTVVEKSRVLCREAGVTVRSLPSPSRNALAELKRIASLSPDDLPPPGERRAPPPVRVRGLVAALHRVQDALGGGAPSRADQAALFDTLGTHAARTETLCEKRGSAPAGLPKRSRDAYALLRWLAGRENFDRYVRQAETAARVLPKAARGGRIPDRIEVRFLPGEHIFLLEKREDLHRWRLGLGFLDAGPADFEDLARVVRAGRRVSKTVGERYRRFVHAPEFHRIDQVLESLAEGNRFSPRGCAHDLEALFRGLNRKFFEGRLSKPNLHWKSSPSITLFGTYTEWLDLVTLNALLDDPALPRLVPEAVLYHELLHKKHGAKLTKGRRLWHTPAFRADEKRYPHLEEAKRRLEDLARGKRPKGKRTKRTEQLLLPFD